MALNVYFSENIKRVQKKFNRFLKHNPKIVRVGLAKAGEQLRRIIETKTTRGEKYTSGRFPGYSPEYSALKGKTVVDLQDSNRMLQSMKSRVVNNYKTQLYFNDMSLAKRAYWHQVGAGNLPQRPFFGFNKKVENVIKKSFEKHIATQIKRMKL